MKNLLKIDFKSIVRRKTQWLLTLIAIFTLGVGEMWGAAKQRYIYCGISEHYDNNKDGNNWGFNFFGGTGEGVKTPTYIQDDYHDGRNYKVYRVQVYDDNNKAQFKGNSSWWIPGDGYSVTLNGTTNNAVYFSASENGWYGQFQKSFQVSSTASLTASNTNVAIGTTVTLTPALTSNQTYNTLKSTSYSVTTNPGSGGSVTSAGVFSATKAGTYTVTATVTYNAKDFTGITNTTTATANITVYSPYTISAGSTIIWDLCANEKSWSAVYLNKGIEGTATNDGFTQCGSTTQYRKTYESAVSKIEYLIFRSNTSNWNDYTQTTDIKRDVSGVTLFEFDNTFTDKKLNWQVTTGAKKATSGTKVYFDNTATNWSEVWLKYGTTRFNRHSGAAATKVTGTANLYVITMPEAYYVKWYFADNYGYTNRYSIENMTSISNRIDYQATDLTSEITYIPSTGSGTPKVWNTSTITGGHKRRLTFGSHTNGNISVRYTDESGTEQTVSSSSASYVDVAQTCQVVITAVPNSGYAPSGLTLGGGAITSGAQQIIRADGTIVATFVAEETHDVTVSYKIGSRTLHDAQTFEVGVTTPSSISAEVIDGFSFSSWSDLTNVTNNTGNTTTNPISINTIESGSNGSMTCNYTQWPCSLDIVASEGATGYSSRSAMSYDATTKAYYKEVTTSSSTERYRFYINSIEYSPSSNTEMVLAGTKIAAATDVTGYASNKPSAYFNDGPSGSKIIVWFDYENKKAWVQEKKYTVTITSGGNGTVSPSSVSVGNITASGTITATASDHYHWSSWDVPSGVTIASGSGTRSITIKASAASKTVTARFAGDQYTITYKDKGNVTFSGTQTDAPTTHTYGTATTLKIPTKTGYDFGGWFTASDCASGAVGNTSAASLGATAFTANITLYAKWTAKNYTTSNNLKDADEVNDGQYNVTYDNTSIAHTSDPSKSGYTIVGYYKEAGCSNLIANADRSLVSSSAYTSSGKWKYTSAPDLYVKWQQTLTLAGNGANSTNGSITTTYYSTATTGHTAATRTGYQLAGYYDATSGGNKVINTNGTLVSYSASISDYLNSDGKWIYDGTPTLSAQWEANTYQVQFHRNGGAGDVVYQDFTYDVAQNLEANTYTRTGYSFAGWALTTGGAVTYADGAEVSNLTSTNDATYHLYAKWTANTYSVRFNANGGSGSMSNENFTYDASAKALTNNAFSMDGYAFSGWATTTERAAAGTVDYTNGQSVRNLTSTASGIFNLYAVWTKVELTDLTFDPVQAAPGETVTITPVLSATPTGNSAICWGLYYDAECSSAVSPAVTFTSNPSSGSNTVTFTAPAVSGTYHVKAIYRAGTTCDGTVHNTYIESYTLASDHTATIKYVCGGAEISARGSVTIPAGDSAKIGPKEIIGYTFSSWSADPVIKLGSRDGDSVKIGATYDGIITATYTKKKMIYFNNTLGWSDVYVYFYEDNKYWDNTYGAGAKRGQGFGSPTSYPYTNEYHGHMTQIEGTNIWYFDYTESSIPDKTNAAFTEANQHTYQWFDKTKAVIVSDFNHPDSLPMYVPLASPVEELNKHDDFKTLYYRKGYWMNYPENTGYTLRIYEAKTKNVSDLIQAIPFEFSEDKTMPMELTVELAGGRTYGFEIKRNDGSYYGNNSTMKFGSSGDQGQTVWEFKTTSTYRCELKTSVAGNYTFTLNYGKDNSSNYNYLVGVHYPVAVGSYRIVYNDGAKWSKSSAHTSSWYHASRTIAEEIGAEDIVSFYVAKGSTPSMKFQYAKSIDSEGVVTWRDTTGATIGAIRPDTISTSGVYNFVLTQPETGGITVSAVEPYTGNYYIRTNGVEGKWNNYLNSDHLMPYSDYSFHQDKNPYSHYFTQWVKSGTSISFTVANDYSSCISDTLIKGVSADKDAAYSITNESTGVMSSDANVRFMYNKATNEISRAYISGSTTLSERFLVLEGSAKMYNAEGNALSISGLNANEMNFTDKQNWIYEATVKANPGANVRLTAMFNSNVQYLKGGNNGLASDSVALLGGTGSGKYKVQVVYDFKINRLVTAWLPDNNDAISDSLKINADVMIVRSHQQDPDAITFSNSGGAYGALTDVKTVYGVMKFNRWILNNRANPENTAVSSMATNPEGDIWVYNESVTNTYHPVLTEGNQKSIYERAHYYISFPFDVKLSDVFGFGTYWDEWYIEYYDGKTRAKNGYWIDSKPNWKYVTTAMKNDFVLKAYEGYILGLDLDYMQYNNTSFWTANSSEVSLYFPSSGKIDTISYNQVTVKIDTVGYKCTINRNNGPDGDRRVKDSHWHCIGVPSYSALVQTVNALPEEEEEEYDWTTQTTPYVYRWNMTDNTVTPVATSSATEFTFQPMHAYLVQYALPEITWAYGASTPQKRSIMERSTDNGQPRECEFRLELQKNGEMADQTYVRLTDDENVTTDYEFNYDLVKEMNSVRSNVYTLIGYEKAAANMLPLQTEQTTTVPVGVLIREDGEYTFAMVDGTHGVGVTLFDNVLNTRTSLSALNYTVNLTAGEYTNRFMLEISPISQVHTDIDMTNGEGKKNEARKVMIDGLLYIVKDGKVFDARGAIVK